MYKYKNNFCRSHLPSWSWEMAFQYIFPVLIFPRSDMWHFSKYAISTFEDIFLYSKEKKVLLWECSWVQRSKRKGVKQETKFRNRIQRNAIPNFCLPFVHSFCISSRVIFITWMQYNCVLVDSWKPYKKHNALKLCVVSSQDILERESEMPTLSLDEKKGK